MSATASRSISTGTDARQLGVAVGALILAVALLVALAVSRQASFATTPAAEAPAAVVHDHGWSTTNSGTPAVVIPDDASGYILYTGIPYFPADDAGSGPMPRERFAE